MLHPLASLWRQFCRVTFYAAGGQPAQASLQALALGKGPHGFGSQRRFRSADDALRYLLYWQSEPAARAELKRVLQTAGPSLATASAGMDGWLHILATRLVQGAVVVLEEFSRQAMPGRLAAPPASGLAAAALSSLPSLADLPQMPALVNLLPALEDIRIEAVEVQPELDQTLVQINLSMASVTAASLSLEPAPDKVADIQTSLSDAIARSSAALAAV